jgi:hypothetical protein
VEQLELLAASLNLSLAALLLKGPASRQLLDLLGRSMLTQPALLHELAALVKVPQAQLAAAAAPVVIGPLCVAVSGTALRLRRG